MTISAIKLTGKKEKWKVQAVRLEIEKYTNVDLSKVVSESVHENQQVAMASAILLARVLNKKNPEGVTSVEVFPANGTEGKVAINVTLVNPQTVKKVRRIIKRKKK